MVTATVVVVATVVVTARWMNFANVPEPRGLRDPDQTVSIRRKHLARYTAISNSTPEPLDLEVVRLTQGGGSRFLFRVGGRRKPDVLFRPA
eukprot:742491-Alexandrium_andersonii.AAC.1